MTYASSPFEVAVVAANQVMRDALTASLQARGFAVAVFESLEGFLGETPGDRFGCLVADLAAAARQDDELGALAVSEALRKRGLGLPAILLSGHARVARGGLVAQPKLSVLVKPVDPALLAQLVCRAVAMIGSEGSARSHT